MNPAPRDVRAAAQIPHAAALAVAVHEGDAEGVQAAYSASGDPAALAVALASMVDLDAPQRARAGDFFTPCLDRPTKTRLAAITENLDPWFPRDLDESSIGYAHLVCFGCSMRESCLEDAIAAPAGHDRGIRGGMTPGQRRRLRAVPAGHPSDTTYRPTDPTEETR